MSFAAPSTHDARAVVFSESSHGDAKGDARAMAASEKGMRASAVRLARRGRVLSVETAHFVMTLDERLGGCMTGFRAHGGPELLAGPSNDLLLHSDGGGLWRVGHELRSHHFSVLWRACDRIARLEPCPLTGGVEIVTHVIAEGQRLTRRYFVEAGSPVLRMRIEGCIGRGRALVGRFATAIRSTEARMDAPGGVVSRPPRKRFAPTFWPCTSWARVGNGVVGGRLAPSMGLFLGGPSCVSFDGEGELAFVAVRNATRERGRFGLPLFGFSVSGTNDGPCVLDYAVHAGGHAGVALTDAAMALLAEVALAPAAHDGAAELVVARRITTVRLSFEPNQTLETPDRGARTR